MKQHVLPILREIIGMNQTDFSEIVDCSEVTIQAVERGPARLKLSDVLAKKIALATGVSPDWLLANDKAAPIINQWGKPYRKLDFEIAQAANETDVNPAVALHSGITYAARLLAFNSAAWNAGWNVYQLAMYKMNVVLSQFEKEFGFEELVYKPGAANIKQAVAALRAYLDEMEAAERAIEKPVKLFTRQEQEKIVEKARKGPPMGYVELEEEAMRDALKGGNPATGRRRVKGKPSKAGLR